MFVQKTIRNIDAIMAFRAINEIEKSRSAPLKLKALQILSRNRTSLENVEREFELLKTALFNKMAEETGGKKEVPERSRQEFIDEQAKALHDATTVWVYEVDEEEASRVGLDQLQAIPGIISLVSIIIKDTEKNPNEQVSI
jgi:hypothetical protein